MHGMAVEKVDILRYLWDIRQVWRDIFHRFWQRTVRLPNFNNSNMNPFFITFPQFIHSPEIATSVSASSCIADKISSWVTTLFAITIKEIAVGGDNKPKYDLIPQTRKWRTCRICGSADLVVWRLSRIPVPWQVTRINLQLWILCINKSLYGSPHSTTHLLIMLNSAVSSVQCITSLYGIFNFSKMKWFLVLDLRWHYDTDIYWSGCLYFLGSHSSVIAASLNQHTNNITAMCLPCNFYY